VEVEGDVDNERNEGLCEGNIEVDIVYDEDMCGVSCTKSKRSRGVREKPMKDYESQL